MVARTDLGRRRLGRVIGRCAKRRWQSELSTMRVCTKPASVHRNGGDLVHETKWTFRSGKAGKESQQATKVNGRTAIAGARRFEIGEGTIGGHAVGPVSIKQRP